MAQPIPLQPKKEKSWKEKISRSSYFFGALLLHLIVFLMVATLVIFRPFSPPTDDFTKTYIPPPQPPPPPPSAPQMVQVPTKALTPPTPTITAPSAAPAFSVPLPDFSTTVAPTAVTQNMTTREAPTQGIPSLRLSQIASTVAAWGRSTQDIQDSNSDPHNIKAKFPVYLASYADGDWGCNTYIIDGKINAGSLSNLVNKINEWSHGNITGYVVPDPLDIGGPELLAKKPPFIFFTGHKDFILTGEEIQNLRDYLQIGGAIWGDNCLAGRGSRFDVAFRREMKRVVPDADKNFEPVSMDDPIFVKSWNVISKLPTGMNYYAEPVEHLDIDGKLAILYTPNDYSDLFCMNILPGDASYAPPFWNIGIGIPPNTLYTDHTFDSKKDTFFRNFQLPSCLAAQQFGMNIIGYLLVRFDDQLLLQN